MESTSARRGSVAITTCSVDDALRDGADVFHPHRLDLLDESCPFSMRIRAVTHGPVTVGMLSYGSPVRLETDTMDVAYEVNVPMSGRLTCRAGRDTVLASPERAVLFGPDEPTGMDGFGPGVPLVGVKLDRVAVEDRLAELTGAPSPLHGAPSIDLSRGRGREWWQVLRSLVDLFDGFDDDASLLNNELVMRPLTQSLLHGVLFAADHPRLGYLLEPGAEPLPGALRRAQEVMSDRAAEPLTVDDVARATGVSVRGLQSAFRRHLDTTPMEFLRGVRLERAHAELVGADPSTTTVAQVAHRWGFTHVGRFAAHHRARYGSSPSESLRAGT